MNIEGRHLPFIDEAKIVVEGGRGGDGCVSFLREKSKPHGGPAGGDGGDGGDVLLIAKAGILTLWEILRRPYYKAEDGECGKGKNRHGADGESLYIEVPCGTKVYDEDGKCVAELLEDGACAIVARGGKGGRGNAHFASSKFQAPHFAEKGESGERRILFLQLYLLADIGIVGPPNVGKSTLLSCITNASPTIAPYPFTTKVPYLGVIKYSDTQIIIAEIPGLLKGAHEGVGLGIRFLRHAQRTKALLILLDITSSDPLTDYFDIMEELRMFDEDILKKPSLIVVNKVEDRESVKKYRTLKKALLSNNKTVLAISALKRKGIKRLLRFIKNLPLERKFEREEKIKYYEYKPLFHIKREKGVFVLKGREIERMVEKFSFDEASLHLWKKWTKKMGIDEALRKAGARSGDRVRIKDKEFIYNVGA